MIDERELIAAAQRGSERAFEQLVRANEKKVYTLCLRMCGNPADAEEAAQEAFLAAWRGLPSFRGESAFSTWLHRLAGNACIDLLRRNRRARGELSLDDELAAEPVDEHASPQRELERREQREAVQRGLAALHDEHRTVLVLREVEQLSYAEIAEVTGLEAGTVKSRISRARAQLRKYLLSEGNFFGEDTSKVTDCNQIGQIGRNARKSRKEESGT